MNLQTTIGLFLIVDSILRHSLAADEFERPATKLAFHETVAIATPESKRFEFKVLDEDKMVKGHYLPQALLDGKDLTSAKLATFEINTRPVTGLLVSLKPSTRERLQPLLQANAELLIVVNGTPRAAIEARELDRIIKGRLKLRIVSPEMTFSDFEALARDLSLPATIKKRKPQ